MVLLLTYAWTDLVLVKREVYAVGSGPDHLVWYTYLPFFPSTPAVTSLAASSFLGTCRSFCRRT